MTTVAEVVDAVIGGDTHRDTHALEMCSPAGATLATLEIENNDLGYAEVLEWCAAHLPGARVMIGLEGTRSYGIGLARALQATGLVVVEVERPKREQRRGRGKSDPIDARLAALALLRMDVAKLPQPRADGDREALRILLISRAEQTRTRTAQANQLHALLLTGSDADRALGQGTFTTARLQQLRDRALPNDASIEHTIRHQETARLATALLAATASLNRNERDLRTLVKALDPTLLDLDGVGPISAAQALVSFSHPGRFRHEGAFAKLAGAAPLQASSGRTKRHRLNRGGDRQLNRALHTIAGSRWRHDPKTQGYVARRRAEGLSDREIRRCLKRYISRQLFRHMTAAALDNP